MQRLPQEPLFGLPGVTRLLEEGNFGEEIVRKIAEKEARKSKEEWEKTFEAMSDIITIQDKDRRIVKANRAAHDIFSGCTRRLERQTLL